MYFILLAEINFEHDTKLKTEALMRCKDLQWLARYAKNVKCKASRMILMLLGINNASKVLGSKLNGRI